jgi:hypothetical protein
MKMVSVNDIAKPRMLDLISNIGVKVDENGHINDQLGCPAGRRSPLGSAPEARH